jgi:hypothetical protein
MTPYKTIGLFCYVSKAPMEIHQYQMGFQNLFDSLLWAVLHGNEFPDASIFQSKSHTIHLFT